MNSKAALAAAGLASLGVLAVPQTASAAQPAGSRTAVPAAVSCGNPETHRVTSRLRTVGRSERRRCYSGSSVRVNGWVDDTNTGDGRCVTVDLYWSSGAHEWAQACNGETKQFRSSWQGGTVRVTIRRGE
ncbi:hypothetical protein [Cryptosporangium arvum]|uniref:Secreted protein n=1 Tax=Cryptosporangium arvum DSM 44712 TaxID=927661 RepID=A0A010ZW14_9ACTN|nr:hypothetical protein [Cryptosporangium arvum]EXG82859.1 hypothetical protein CryarDRAFT_4061 [Cryptosporangium arvum DSM 44712]